MKKILVGVDFSAGSEVAIKQALRVARHTGAELCLLHVGVIPEQPVGVPDAMATTAAAYTRIVKDKLAEDREALARMRERVSGQGVEVSQALTDGFADTAIVRAATEMHADLIVIGTHGRTGIKRFLLGSIAERVVRLASCNVLVARPGGDDEGGFHRILVPTDFTEAARRALDLGVKLAAPGAAVDLLHCWQLPALTASTYGPVKSLRDLDEGIRTTLRGQASAAGQRLLAAHEAAGVELAFHEVEAPPTHGIQDWLADHTYDLVVTGSHGRRGVRRFLLGSVAEVTVRHSPCSVLVVHAGEAASVPRSS